MDQTTIWNWLDRTPLEGVGLHATVATLLMAFAILLASVFVAWFALRLSSWLRVRFGGDKTTLPWPIRFLTYVAFLLGGAAMALESLGIGVRALLAFELFPVSGEMITVTTVLVAAGIVLVAYIISLAAQRAIRGSVETASMQVRANLATVARLVHYAIMFIGVAIALQTLNVQLNALIAGAGIIAVGIGFAMRNIIENFMSGLLLLLERAIKPNDVLSIEGRVCRVVQLGIRTTIVRTRDGEEIIVPNTIIAQSSVKNFTYRDSYYRLKAPVGVAYSSDMKHVHDTLLDVAASFPDRTQRHEPEVRLTEFGSSSVNFEVNIWLDDPWASRAIASKLNQAIWDALIDEGITIAFPQLDLHVDGEVIDALGRSGPRAA